MSFGRRVREARKRAGLSQEALARRAGMSLPGVAKIEQGGVTDPHYSTLQKLAEALDVAPLWLVTGEAVEEPVGAGKAEAPRAGRLDKEPPVFDVVREAVLEQDKENWQAMHRGDESGLPQPSLVRHENEAMAYLLKRPLGDVEEAYIDLMRRHVWLEQDNTRLERENARLKEELARVHANG